MSEREPDNAVEAAGLDDDAEILYEEAPCGYLSTRPDGTIARANRTFLRWTGYEAPELVGRRRFSELLPPGARIYYETHYAPLLQMQGRVRELALEVVRADGSRLPVLVNAVLERDVAGEPRVVRVTVFDASDRRRYERELLRARAEAESRAAAATALEHVAEGVVLLDEDARIRLLNGAAERILGVTGGEARGLPLTALAPGWGAVAARVPVGHGAEDAPTPIVVPLELPTGTRWLAAAGRAAPEGVVYTFRDVTEERRLEHLRDDMVAVVSHELRTPLAAVYGAAQTLASLGERLDDEQRRELVEAIGDGAARLTRTVGQMVLMDRLTRGEVVPERRSFDVARAVERIVAGTRAEQRIAVELAEGVVAEGDPALFEQVLAALLDNAAKFSPADGEIRVCVERVRASARVVVADDGPGIPPEHGERIFERFFRLDPDQVTGAAGAGLGLSIARELVTRMRGRIALLPTDAGAAFAVDLPAQRGRP